MWRDLSAPGKYRGCTVFLDSFEKKIDMIPGGDNRQMTVERCLNQCNKKKHTYAGLLGGTQCNCLNFTGPMDSLHYVPTSQCSVPCSGDPTYNCGGRNSTFSLYRTKVPDSRCSKISLKPKGSMPLIGLASFPRSGNTWTRQLLEHATGIYTGSIYWKAERRKVGSKIFLGGNIPFDTGSTLCTKVHVFNAQMIKTFHRGTILLLRNPYRAIVSEAFRSHKGVKGAGKKFVKSRAFHIFAGWTRFVRKHADRWLGTAINWCRKSSRLLVVNYEDLQENTSEELMRMIKFLKQPLDMTRITCAVQELPSSQSTGVSLGSFGLRSKTYLTFDPFTKRMHERLDGHIATVNATLIRYGHAPLPNYEEAGR
ncbi:WSC domain-containing protein 2 [Holothuria leucospilota]|uniref:WSC domain-containing protein 2 n=1 Tax=Holothuria leucospilota TaxID=206669 RepID=A0A9Q1HBQ6_HOLLE|nr:WSC domain-containing protein 2 [Holothuria leucospilota]